MSGVDDAAVRTWPAVLGALVAGRDLPAAATAWGPVTTVGAVATTASTAARGALEAGVDLNEDLLLLLSTGLRGSLALQSKRQYKE